VRTVASLVFVDPAHPERDDDRLLAVCEALVARGAVPRIDAAGDNLVRKESDGTVVVESQGLANLVHEYVHMICAGVLDDDHGIDYTRIPFDARTSHGRELLFGELAAAVVSCAWTADRTDPVAWFHEQLAIQPVFYGLESNPSEFWRVVEEVVAQHGEQLHRVLETVYGVLEREVAAVAGVPFRPPGRLTFASLWERAISTLASPDGDA
jgi:hypothetical protein